MAATDPDARAGLITQLARGARSAPKMTTVADRFRARGEAGRRVMLEWVARARGTLPQPLIERILPLLSDDTILSTVRVAAAARVLRALPDKAAAVKPVVAALTAGLPVLDALDRLRQVQHQIEKSRALDAVIDRRERRVKLDCPRCGARLRRVGMVKHLWHAHGLILEHGVVRGPDRRLEDLKEAHAESRDTTLLDRAAFLAGPADMRAWVAASDPPADDTAPLLAAASERRAGLCPACFAEVPEPVPPLPPPLVLTGRRLSGDGYVVEVGGSKWVRTRAIETPTRVIPSGRDRVWALGVRGAASLAAGVVVVAALVAARSVPVARVNPVAVVGPMILCAAAVYAVVYTRWRIRPSSRETVVDTAWAVLARRLLARRGSDDAGVSRFLTRLCRASVGRGDLHARAGVLKLVEKRARGTAESAPDVPLLAAATYLQLDDAARLGRDRGAGVAALAAAAFRGELPFDYAEAVAECFSATDPEPAAGERARVRVLLIAAAFEAGLKPRDLTDAWAVAPHLRRAMAVEPLHRLGLLHGVWRMRGGRRWERVGRAESVFDLCRTAPLISGRLLADLPDLLLCSRSTAAADEDPGPVSVCARGVAFGGVLVGDPDAEVGVTKVGRFGGGYVLTFGRERVPLNRRPPDDFADTLRKWLRFRTAVLLPHIDSHLERGPAAVAARVMRPFTRTCANCGAVSAVAAGMVGKPLRTQEL